MSKVYTLGCKDIGIQIFDFDAKTRFLLEFNAYTFPPVQFFTGMIKKVFSYLRFYRHEYDQPTCPSRAEY